MNHVRIGCTDGDEQLWVTYPANTPLLARDLGRSAVQTRDGAEIDRAWDDSPQEQW